MANLFDYIEKYGDLSLQEKELTEIDLIIFSQLSYINFSVLNIDLSKKENLSFIAEELQKINYSNKLGLLIPDTILPIFYLMSKKKRYKDILICDYEKEVDKDKVKQFCAITFILTKQLKCISFSGTDDSIAGWKENLNMLCLDATPSQIHSKEYLAKQSKGYKGNIIVTGHSKGGNLAFYSVIHSNRYVKPKIQGVYSFDGPGLSNKDCKKMLSLPIYDKFTSYITECSIVGKLFLNTAKTIVCKSSNYGIMQHDSFSWIVEDDCFVRGEKEDENAINIDKKVKEITDAMSSEERKEFVNVLFKIIGYISVDNLIDLKTSQKLSVVKGYFAIESESRKLLNKIALKMIKDKSMRKIFIDTIMEYARRKSIKQQKNTKNLTSEKLN